MLIMEVAKIRRFFGSDGIEISVVAQDQHSRLGEKELSLLVDLVTDLKRLYEFAPSGECEFH